MGKFNFNDKIDMSHEFNSTDGIRSVWWENSLFRWYANVEMNATDRIKTPDSFKFIDNFYASQEMNATDKIQANVENIWFYRLNRYSAWNICGW